MDWHGQGIAAARAGRFGEAVALLQRAVKKAPKDPVLHADLGLTFARMADWPAARTALLRAVELAPGNVSARVNLANVLRQHGDDDGARLQLEAALKREPQHALARFNLGNLHKDRQGWAAAEAQYLAALRARPDHHDARHALGNVLKEQNRIGEAIEALRHTVQQAPRPRAWHDLGNAYGAANQYDDARAAYQQALQLQPDFALSHYVLGTLDLKLGNWGSGWRGYEARFAALGQALPASRLPRWFGEPVPATAALLIYPEQGYGDMIQFARFLPRLRERFARVTMICPTALLRLFAGSFPDIGFVDTIPADEAGYTHYMPVMSLATVLGITEAALDGAAYLKTPATAGQASPRRIGISWTGNPAQADNRWRSMPFEQLAPLWQLPGVRWQSLQYGAEVPSTMQPMPAGDFLDTAALMMQLELVITVCTSVAHLAGALGRPVWLLSRADADWRWQAGRADSPWYGSMRIYRQQQRAIWDDVLHQVVGDLQRGT
ncbi:Tetratricopeptide repeat-containing protein [Andreprevotia lacus DSM 23236]|jgi:Flp pilus assembly protein TadD|uniref:Tetratricopeptide repeat-containing protein n=1 Tax=Andreprevotia lacus DSM 23236 TaxID=1121001 RepID=A0A1W1XFH9_9NEIS|nr:tetratricopeptide repeat protein [Andreprevotia lacus]SMC22358.1 Tetratricopeptide repeat-containing protein [Andreprevotia lacus DSM 23236]